MPNLKGPELLIIVLLLMLLFGARRMPDAARSIGRSLRIFKAETKGLVDDDANPAGSQPAPPVVQSAPAPIAPTAPQAMPQAAPLPPVQPATEPQAGGSLAPQPPSQA